MEKVRFCAGNEIGQADDEKIVVWDSEEKSQHDLMKDSLLWASGRFPESDCEYTAAVWVEGENGDVIDSENVTISLDGEMNFPA